MAQGLTAANEIPIRTAAMGTEAGEQLHTFEQVGFPLAVRPHHDQPGGLQRQLQGFDVSELLKLQALQPHDVRKAAKG
jgi:hypothetical protein